MPWVISRHHIHQNTAIHDGVKSRYDITPEQATAMFDMLDSEREGRVLESDLFKHFLPLLEKTGLSGPPRKESTGRRESSVKGVRNCDALIIGRPIL